MSGEGFGVIVSLMGRFKCGGMCFNSCEEDSGAPCESALEEASLQACKGEECAQVFGEKSQPDVCGVWPVKRRSLEWCQGSHFPRKEHGSR